MLKKNEREIRTSKKKLLVCRYHEVDGIPTLEFIHQKKKDEMTVDELIRKIYVK